MNLSRFNVNRIKPGINLSRVLRQVDRAELAPPKEKKPEPEAAAPAPEGAASGAAKAGEKGKEKEKEVKKLTKKQVHSPSLCHHWLS